MKVGMLWFENDLQCNLDEKILKAAAHYQQKYHQKPNLCFVHPTMILDSNLKAKSIVIRSAITIRPNHIWIGFTDEDAFIGNQDNEKSG